MNKSYTNYLSRTITHPYATSDSSSLPTGLYHLAEIILKNHFSKCFWIMLSGIIASACHILCSVLLSKSITDITDFSHSGNGFWYIFTLLVMASSVMFFLNTILRLKSLNTFILENVLGELWRKIIFSKNNICCESISGELTRQIFDFESALSSAITVLIRLCSHLFSFLLLFCFMIYQFSIPAMILCAIFFIIFATRMALMPLAIRYTALWLVQQKKLSALLNETLLGIQKIRSTHTENFILNRWINQLFQIKKLSRLLVRTELFSIASDTLAPAILLFSLQFLLYRHTNTLSPKTCLSFIILGGQFSALMSEIFKDTSLLIPILPAFYAIKPLTRLPDVSIDPSVSAPLSIKGAITIDRVSFQRGNGTFLLRDIDFSLAPGEFATITGPSGSGKSTLFRLILGLDEPTSGKILVDSRNILHMDIKKLRQQFGLVLQNQSLLPGTIYDNIVIHTPLTQGELWKLVDMVGLRTDIESMPMGLHTYLSDQTGESISGGQRQKILLARALATHPRVLLLDEATSALDNDSQAHICNSLADLKITRIAIAHRLSTAKGSDLIYEIKNGQGKCLGASTRLH